MYNALLQDHPVVFMEHKYLSEDHLDFLGSGGRGTVQFDPPSDGWRGPVPQSWKPVPFGKARVWRQGGDITIASVGVGVHRAVEAAGSLEKDGISTGVIDLRSISPLDKDTLCEQVSHSGQLLVVDEDYESFGLSGELAAVVSEAGIPFKFIRVCTRTTIPYARQLEDATLPNVKRICSAAHQLMA
jgi:pyruvate dehydrogenase E1 component beta subunit